MHTVIRHSVDHRTTTPAIRLSGRNVLRPEPARAGAALEDDAIGGAARREDVPEREREVPEEEADEEGGGGEA